MPKLSREEEIALGQICGCENCKYCYTFRIEQVHREMEEMVHNGKDIAERSRNEFLQKWKEKNEQPKRRTTRAKVARVANEKSQVLLVLRDPDDRKDLGQ